MEDHAHKTIKRRNEPGTSKYYEYYREYRAKMSEAKREELRIKLRESKRKRDKSEKEAKKRILEYFLSIDLTHSTTELPKNIIDIIYNIL